MGKTKVRPDQFGKALSGIIKEYSDDTVKEMPDVVKEVAKNTVKKLKSRSQQLFNGTQYSKSFKNKKITDNSNVTSYVVYSDLPQLTTWLEHGHNITNQTGQVYGHTPAKPHWADAEEEAIKELENMLVKSIGGT